MEIELLPPPAADDLPLVGRITGLVNKAAGFVRGGELA